jgi:hypothetical protein
MAGATSLAGLLKPELLVVVQAVAGSSPVAHPHKVAAQDGFLRQRYFRSALGELPMSYQFFGGAGGFEVPEPGSPRMRAASRLSAKHVLTCWSSTSRTVHTDGEDRTMAQTDQAWDWGVELRDEERSELELLRRTVAQLRNELDQANESLRGCRQRQQDARQALRQLDEARLWRRRRFRTALRERQLL